MLEFDHFIKEKLEIAKAESLYREFTPREPRDSIYIYENGKKYISFCSNDYLGLSVNKDVIEAGQNFPSGSGASRLVTGSHPLYDKLEDSLARIKKTEKALVFGSGYLTNLGIISSLVSDGDLIVADKLVHASMLDGAILSGAKILRFAHNDAEKCEKILKEHRKDYKKCLILTETVFSMDGDLAPVDKLYELANLYRSWLYTDDAHGFGTIEEDKKGNAHIKAGTLSKAVGAYGGYVCGSSVLIDYLVNFSRPLIFTTALPPSVIASAIKSVEIIENNKKLCDKPLENARYFTMSLGIKEAQSPIVAIIIGDSKKAVDLSEELKNNGFMVLAIRPPTVPRGTSRLRFTFSSLHEKEDIDRLVNLLKSKDLSIMRNSL